MVPLISYYGRHDDILSLDNIDFKDYILKEIQNPSSLIFKWLPSEGSHSPKVKAQARTLRKYLGFSSKKYRKMLTAGRKNLNLVETKLTNKDYKSINYSHVPSKANLKYKKAFSKNDAERYVKYLGDAKSGKVKINTSTIFPYEIVKQAKAESTPNETLEVLWQKLPDYTNKHSKALVVADVSGSMSGDPICMSVGLAMYFAERNEGIFKNKFISFSAQPELQELKGNTLSQRIKNLESTHWDMNTNLQAVFDLILNTGIKNKVPEEDMPSTLYIISDMEFDSACEDDETNFSVIRKKYEKAGYKMPQLEIGRAHV